MRRVTCSTGPFGVDEHELGQVGRRLAAGGPRGDDAPEQQQAEGGQRRGCVPGYGTAVTV